MAGKIRLGELLVRAGVLDELKLKAALAEQQRWGGRLGRILVDMNFVSEDLLTKALSKQLGFPRATFVEMNIPASILAKVPADFARSNACCPEHFDPARNLLTVAMADPTNMPVADEIRFKTGLRVEATIAGEAQISRAIDSLYGTRSGGYATQFPEAIDLPPAEPERGGFAMHSANAASAGNQAFTAAMAASGLSIDEMGQPWNSPATGPIPLSAPGPRMVPGSPLPAARTSDVGPVHRVHTTGPLELSLSTGSLDVPGRSTNGHVPTAVPVSSFQGAPVPHTDGVAHRLEAAQKKQHRAVQVMIDLLIEKGVFTRDEFAELIKRRGH